MLDIFNIPGQQDNIKIFYALSGTNSWQTWTKPRNCKFIWMMCIGAGAGGQTTGTTGPGFGGGSGAVTRALFPATVLPDTLYVQPGAGVIANANRSFVSITPSSALLMNLVCVSGNSAAVVTGAGETIATVAGGANLLSLGTFISIAGRTNPNTATITPLTTATFTCPGGNGGTISVSIGTNIGSTTVGTFTTPNISGGTVINAGGISDSGTTFWKPFFSLGGAGGNSSNIGVGGRGGDGGIGSGGGGCGGGAAAGASGGKGGGGLVIIATF